MTNPYSLLKIRPGATTEEVEAAYERLFDKYEPLAEAGDDDATAMLDRLNEAYDALSDPENTNMSDKISVALWSLGPTRTEGELRAKFAELTRRAITQGKRQLRRPQRRSWRQWFLESTRLGRKILRVRLG